MGPFSSPILIKTGEKGLWTIEKQDVWIEMAAKLNKVNVLEREKYFWSLSPDGRVLTVTTTRNTPALQNSYKTIYNKK